jgi:hypothetical protein
MNVYAYGDIISLWVAESRKFGGFGPAGEEEA